MFLARRRGQVVYEDLLKELEAIERRLLPEDSGAAMNLMVLEAKLRERFQKLEFLAQGRFSLEDEGAEPLIKTDPSALIPRDLLCYSDFSEDDQDAVGSRSTAKTVGVAAALAIFTACAVFGLASALQMVLSWLS